MDITFSRPTRAAVVWFWAVYWGGFFLFLPWMLLRQVGITVRDLWWAWRTAGRVYRFLDGRLTVGFVGSPGEAIPEVVTAPAAVQRARLKKRHGWMDEEIEARISAQWELSAKAALADYVVDNSDGVDATRTQVKRIWNQLRAANRPNLTSRR